MTLFNTTLLSLCMSSLFTPSAFYTFRGMSKSQSMSISNSKFSKSFPNVIQSFIPNVHMRISNSFFNQILSSAISFTAEAASDDWSLKCSLGPGIIPIGSTAIPNIPIKNMTFGEGQSWVDSANNRWNDHHTYFTSNKCGSLLIFAGCTFKSCYVTLQGTETDESFNPDETGGGALFVNYTNVSVTVHETIFDDCTTGSKRGAALLITGGCRPQHYDGSFEDYFATYIDIQFCCFQNCYGFNTKIYGSAAFLGGQTTLLYFASTINCSDTKKLEGAQFDIQADNVTSKNVNITGGNAQYCSGMQIRRATNGFFKFQTIFGTKGSYITSYSNISITGDMMSHCNLVNNTLQQFNSDINHGLIHAIGNSIEVSYFYFGNNTFNGGYYATRPKDSNNITITLSNCFSDAEENSTIDYVTFTNCNFSIADITTLELDQLFLGSCQGNRKPDALLYSATWTPTESFTQSSFFTQSSVFVDSNEFSRSLQFPTSAAFMPSNQFSKSNNFTHSISFTSSTEFSPSASYTQSTQFTSSASYTASTEFTSSAPYTSSTEFTSSASYTSSTEFTSSAPYTASTEFTSSASYTASTEFTSSASYTSSTEFTSSASYTASTEFTSSTPYTQSAQFTSSVPYTQTTEFTSSVPYTQTTEFTSSVPYTSSTEFTSSVPYTSSTEFTSSAPYTASTEFTSSAPYTQSAQFTSSVPYTPSAHFTPSSSYTPSHTYTRSTEFTSSISFTDSHHFTISNQFSNSNLFLPSRTYTPSQSFTPSILFSSSDRFTFSDQFSISDHFTYSGIFTKSESFSEPIYFLRQSTKNAKEISKGAIAGICVIFIAANIYIILTAVSAYKLRKERKEYLRAMNEEEDIFDNEEEEYYYSEEEEEAESGSYYDSNYSSYYSGSYEASGSYGTSGSNEYSGSYGSSYNYSYSGA